MTCSKDQKVTEMVLKVDLDCCQCYKKVKKVLCKFPQIRNQVFNEKNNTVTITVFCCSPERIRDKLCCKAGKSIKSIEIKEPQKPKQPPAPAQPEKPKQPPAPAQPEKPNKPKEPAAPLPISTPGSTPKPQKPKAALAPAPEQPEKIQKNGSKKTDQPPQEAPPKPAPKPTEPAPAPAPAPAPPKQQEPEAQWAPVYPPGPPPQMFPVSVCCAPCYEGRPGGPCYGPGPGSAYPYGYYGHPCPPPPGYCGSRCDYFSEENPAACSIM